MSKYKEVRQSKKEEESIKVFIPVSGNSILVYSTALVRWKEGHEATRKLAPILKSNPNEVNLHLSGCARVNIGYPLQNKLERHLPHIRAYL
jgi:hypothetical protein